MNRFSSSIRLLALAAVFTVGPAAGAEAPDDRSAAPPQPLGTFELDDDRSCPLVPVTLGKRRLPFNVDTGSTGTVFDSSLSDHLGLELRQATMNTPAGSATIRRYAMPLVSLGDIPLSNAKPCYCMDLESIRLASDRDIRGVLGMQQLKSFIVQFDFDRRRMNVYAPDTPPADWGSPVPLTFGKLETPRVSFTCNSVPGSALVDTGAAFSHVRSEMLDALKRLKFPVTRVARSRSVTMGGEVDTTIYRVGTLSLGEFEHADWLVDDGKENVIGIDVLSRYLVTFDFPRSTMYLKKGRRFDEPSRRLDSSALFVFLEPVLTAVERLLGIDPAP